MWICFVLFCNKWSYNWVAVALANLSMPTSPSLSQTLPCSYNSVTLAFFFFFFNVPGTYQSLSYLRAFVHVHAHKKPSDLRWAGTLFHLYISTQSHLLKKAFSCHLIQSRQPSRVFHIVSHLFICCTLRLSCLFTCGFFPSSIPAGKDLVWIDHYVP